MATPTDLDLMWQMLCSAFPGNRASKQTAGLYAAQLVGVDGELLLAATWRTIGSTEREWNGFPAVSEIKRAAVHIVCELKCMTPAWAERELGQPIPSVLEYVGLPAPYLALMGEQQLVLAAPGGGR